MAEHEVPGISVALLRPDGTTELHGCGVLSTQEAEPVTPDTLFQVGSISKHVTAFATLRLAAEGRLGLDDSVNRHLTSWQLADLDSAPGEVTIRHLLGHLAGLARHRSVGFRPDEELPTLLDLLEGTEAVATPRVSRQLVPGTTFRKSSTHYWVLQQLLEDVTGESFQTLMHRLVLGPVEMTGSSFDQSFPHTAGRPVALGHHARGVALGGGWRNRAHLAAAGLWTTAEDIAKLARQVRCSVLGRPGALLPADLARQLLATHPGSFYGLGTIVDEHGEDAEFGHGGEPMRLLEPRPQPPAQRRRRGGTHQLRQRQGRGQVPDRGTQPPPPKLRPGEVDGGLGGGRHRRRRTGEPSPADPCGDRRGPRMRPRNSTVPEDDMQHAAARHLISINDLTDSDLRGIVASGASFALEGTRGARPLQDTVAGIYFSKTSTRTRTAFSSGALRLGASLITYGPGDLQLNTGESTQDTGAVLSRMLDVLVARTAA